MKLNVVVPAIGESITEATMGIWLKSEGDFVEEDEIICEVESEKATIEVVAEKAGSLSLKAAEGDTVEIGATIAEIDTSAEGTSQPAPESQNENPAKTEAPTEAKVESSTKISPVAANILNEAGIKAEDRKSVV